MRNQILDPKRMSEALIRRYLRIRLNGGAEKTVFSAWLSGLKRLIACSVLGNCNVAALPVQSAVFLSWAEFEEKHMILSIVGAKSGSQGELVGQRAAVNTAWLSGLKRLIACSVLGNCNVAALPVQSAVFFFIYSCTLSN
jgi:hypothetical protein